MPGNVAAASPVGVLPYGVSTAFRRTRKWEANINTYRNGEAQVGELVTAECSRWEQTRRLTAADAEALRLFYLARNGAHIPFWFYDPEEGPWDSTGTATTGRYSARFDGPLQVGFGVGRSTVPLAVQEIA